MFWSFGRHIFFIFVVFIEKKKSGLRQWSHSIALRPRRLPLATQYLFSYTQDGRDQIDGSQPSGLSHFWHAFALLFILLHFFCYLSLSLCLKRFFSHARHISWLCFSLWRHLIFPKVMQLLLCLVEKVKSCGCKYLIGPSRRVLMCFWGKFKGIIKLYKIMNWALGDT